MKRLVMAPSLSAENTKIICHSMDRLHRVLLPMGITFLCLVPRCCGGGAGAAGSQLPSSRDRLELILDTLAVEDSNMSTKSTPTHLDRILAILPCSSPSASISTSQFS